MGAEVSSQAKDKIPEKLQRALDEGWLNRLPRTFLPFTRQQLRDWEYLFPHEHKSVENLLVFVASLSRPEAVDLFREVLQLEEKMGVGRWQFSTEEQTILNASLLARSSYYPEWRKAVQKVFDAAEEHSGRENNPGIDSSSWSFHKSCLLMAHESGNAGSRSAAPSNSTRKGVPVTVRRKQFWECQD
jgi:hypothetical protein